jgi:branched-subunit amino acid transport protein
VNWGAILGLGAGAYALKALGVFGLSRARLTGWTLWIVQLLPASLLAALIALQLFETGSAEVVATRVAGVAVGAVAVWRKAPLVVVIVAAAAVTAALRALT